MTNALRIIVLLLSILYTSVSATIINIPGDYPAIQQGIDASTDGDTVLVQPGTYYENINFNGHNIVLGSLFLTTEDTSYIEQTVIDGDSAGSVVTFESGEDSTAVICGFRIQNGYAYRSGAIYCQLSYPNIISNRILSNKGDVAGAIYCENGGPRILGNYITDNRQISGYNQQSAGAIYCYYSNPIIAYNNIQFNFTNGPEGSALRFEHWSSALLVNNVIANNSYTGLSIFSSSVNVINNVISRNTRFGILIVRNRADIRNSIIWENGWYEIYWSDDSIVNIDYSDKQGGWIWNGVGNIDVDPLFRDPANGDFHLMSTACGDTADSPCIDAGDPNILDSLLDCSWGHDGLRSDMGAFGGGDSLITAIFDDIPTIPDRLMLLQNYPNPFNSRTAIRFVLLEPQEAKLTVYDLLGRQIDVLVDEYREAGVHAIAFDAFSLSSGVYFYRLRAGDAVETKRMVLLK